MCFILNNVPVVKDRCNKRQNNLSLFFVHLKLPHLFCRKCTHCSDCYFNPICVLKRIALIKKTGFMSQKALRYVKDEASLKSVVLGVNINFLNIHSNNDPSPLHFVDIYKAIFFLII